MSAEWVVAVIGMVAIAILVAAGIASSPEADSVEAQRLPLDPDALTMAEAAEVLSDQASRHALSELQFAVEVQNGRMRSRK
ncbi:hypothetical protein [Tsukamurella spumae]|uniref:Uncharacterized protein n=1 Tax=Tsukamurella spumae TaxID=44753 RepID=A0A846X2V5_9ACTN|nr:hypothetical protein [Tsukamurella spumae]NKY18896.1 hypothetical protein [Tsukamurella spumae]